MYKRIWSLVLTVAIALSLFAIGPVQVGAVAMTASQTYVDLLKSWEGFSATPYKDNSHYSIGYGTYCAELDDTATVEYYTKNPITVEQGEIWLKEHLAKFEGAVNDFAAKHGLTLKQHQFDALVSFSYNCGDAWMRELDGYFNVAVREMDTGAALLYGIGLWSTSGGKYILINRRMREANMFINGVYGTYPDNYRWVYLNDSSGTVSYKICCFDTNLKTPLNVAFKKIPTGVDANGNAFAYTFAGWYTESGKKVEVLDSSLTRGQNLYARWADPKGNIVTPPAQSQQTAPFPKAGKIANVNDWASARSGPGTSYTRLRKVNKDTPVTVYEEVTGGSYGSGNVWCRIGEGEYVAKAYIRYAENEVTGLTLVKQPAVTDYVQPVVYPKLEGSVLLATYANGYSEAMTVTKSMVSGFDGAKTGKQTLTIAYGGKTTTLAVTVRSAVPDTITSDVYTISGGTLTGVAPGTTAQQLLAGINEREYVKLYSSTGQAMTGDMPVGTDTMAVLMDGDEFKAACTVVIRGDVNGDSAIDGNDAVLLLQYLAGWDVPVNELAADINADDAVDDNDAARLLEYAAGWDITISQ